MALASKIRPTDFSRMKVRGKRLELPSRGEFIRFAETIIPSALANRKTA